MLRNEKLMLDGRRQRISRLESFEIAENITQDSVFN